ASTVDVCTWPIQLGPTHASCLTRDLLERDSRASARVMGVTARIRRETPIPARPSQPVNGSRSPTTTTARTAATAGSARVGAVALLTVTLVSPNPLLTYPRSTGPCPIYVRTRNADGEASSGERVTASTGMSATPPSPKTEPLAAARRIPRLMRRCAAHEYS